METSYNVTGMTCQHCVQHVTEEVSQVPGVESVQVSLDDSSMVVTSVQPIDFAAISEAVDEAGDYAVSPV